jgi:hypothetical protein
MGETPRHMGKQYGLACKVMGKPPQASTTACLARMMPVPLVVLTGLR